MPGQSHSFNMVAFFPVPTPHPPPLLGSLGLCLTCWAAPQASLIACAHVRPSQSKD